MTSYDFFSNVGANVLGGIILAFLFFLAKERLCPLKNINGMWHFEMHTEHAGYNNYKGMRLKYVAILWLEGGRVHGTTEKYYENIPNEGERSYVGKGRVRGEIDGYYEKNYLRRDRLFLHIVEDGEKRESTHCHDLIILSEKEICGNFRSTVAKQEGKVRWQRDIL